ncbi:helix-turn-helix domain-containing protein [Chryseobacterium indoltheticum]|uniref:helix-turn-helix domain-containing protein n=1 Tax=Chryseobacterium indoltheticum TaxID=254 RepID=UPI001913A81A|nr:helix-turn-helix domain-containing protein [Chryseobacterium indoltheticum]QQQ28982.1 helix-turn-helix domain-containing protein [Chryseobacterium indoltheticum]
MIIEWSHFFTLCIQSILVPDTYPFCSHLRSTQQHIHDRLIAEAKQLLSATYMSVGKVAFALGYEHSQSFNNLFKSKTKLSPLEFRRSFN